MAGKVTISVEYVRGIQKRLESAYTQTAFGPQVFESEHRTAAARKLDAARGAMNAIACELGVVIDSQTEPVRKAR